MNSKEIMQEEIRIGRSQKENKVFFFSDDFYKREGYISIRPNPPQKRLLDAWDNQDNKVFVYYGGNRMGKTTAGAILAVATLLGYWPWDRNKTPIFPFKLPTAIRWVGQDWEKHVKTVIEPAMDEWWPRLVRINSKKNNMGIRHFWSVPSTGSTLEIMSNKSESDVFEGWRGSLVIYDEPPKRDVRVACARGLVDEGGRELFTMTLIKEAWIHKEVILAKAEDGTPDMSTFCVAGTMFDNVGYGLKREHIVQFAKTLTDEEYEARVNGKPSYLSGLVLPQFDRKKHVIDRFVVPLDYIVDIVIDIHPQKKQAVLFIATSPNNIKFLVNEIHKHGDGTVIANDIIRLILNNSFRVGRILIDPLAKADSNNLETTYGKIDKVLNLFGYYLETASKDKESGILSINNALLGPNNMASLFVFVDMKRTINEAENWMYDKDTGKPQKIDDDMMENLYRGMLLVTQYYPPEDDYVDEEVSNGTDQGANSVTGY